jgi:hypothetical protein
MADYSSLRRVNHLLTVISYNVGMFSGEEIKRNLIGCLETALFMPTARRYFGNSAGEACRSFIIPVLMFPVTIFAFYLYPKPELADKSLELVTILYAVRVAVAWLLSLGTIYWILRGIEREQYFFQFVTAYNWLAIPCTVVVLPVLWMLYSGSHSGGEILPLLLFLIGYSYVFTAFMAAYVLRIPWQLAGFIVILTMAVNDGTMNVVSWVGSII